MIKFQNTNSKLQSEFEIRISNIETISNDKNSNDQNYCFGNLNILVSNLFRISCFEFRIL